MNGVTPFEINGLVHKASQIRASVIEMLEKAGSGHTAGPLGMADVFTCLYFKLLNHNPSSPNWVNRDRVVLSNGHIAPVLYATLAHSGYFPLEELLTLRQFGSRLQGHPHRGTTPGVETTSGPLGQGISQAVGMALGDRLSLHKPDRYFYCLTGDGELNEGQNWEALMTLAKYKLNKVITIVDRNTIQIDGYTEEVMPLLNLRAKFESFGLNVIEIDGHNMEEIVRAVFTAKSTLDNATVIIAHTIPGKGVAEFEGDYRWHGKAPNKEEAKKALKEIRTLKGKVEFM